VTYLLDTNAISDLIRGAAGIESWLSSAGQEDSVVTCTIVRGEILFGIAELPEGKRRRGLEERARPLLGSPPCEPLPERAGDFYAAVKPAQRRAGLVLDENDLWIAATALALGATLVSRDTDFSRIDGLPVLTLS
jgi:predicted nucleic acid-binding protein